MITQKISVAGLGEIVIGLVCHASDPRKLGGSIDDAGSLVDDVVQSLDHLGAVVLGADPRDLRGEEAGEGGEGVHRSEILALVSDEVGGLGEEPVVPVT